MVKVIIVISIAFVISPCASSHKLKTDKINSSKEDSEVETIDETDFEKELAYYSPNVVQFTQGDRSPAITSCGEVKIQYGREKFKKNLSLLTDEYREKVRKFIVHYYKNKFKNNKEVEIDLYKEYPISIAVSGVKGEITREDVWEKFDLIVLLNYRSECCLEVVCVLDGKYESSYLAPSLDAYKNDLEANEMYRKRMQSYNTHIINEIRQIVK